jgi:hypothetical protein
MGETLLFCFTCPHPQGKSMDEPQVLLPEGGKARAQRCFTKPSRNRHETLTLVAKGVLFFGH